LEHLIDGFEFLLDHELNPDTDIWIIILSRFDGRNTSPETQVSFRKLISSFLRHGADMTRIKTVPIPGAKSWLHRFLHNIRMGQTWFCGLEVDALFEVFLQQGLDANITFDDTFNDATLWEHFLDAIHSLGDPCHPVFVKLVLLFLQYRADSHSATRHRHQPRMVLVS